MLRNHQSRFLAVVPALVLVVAAQLGVSAGSQATVTAAPPDAFCAQCGWSPGT